MRYYVNEGSSVYSPLVSQLGSQHWQLFDALGTVLGLTSTDGSLSDSFLYEAFGTSLGRTGTTVTPETWLGMTGAYNEAATAAYVVGVSWMSPGGRAIDGTRMPTTIDAAVAAVTGLLLSAGDSLSRGAYSRWVDRMSDALLDVYHSGYYNCLAKCAIPFADLVADSVLPAKTGGRPSYDLPGDLSNLLSYWLPGKVAKGYEARGLWIELKRGRWIDVIIENPGFWDNLPMELAPVAGRFAAMAEWTNAIGWAITAATWTYCMDKCWCHLEG
jgi:hypothetical protein